jgi:hypothetical protein
MSDPNLIQKQATEYVKLHNIDQLLKEMLYSAVKESSEKPIHSMISYLAEGLNEKDLEREGINIDKSKLKKIDPEPLVKDFYFGENSALIIKRFLTPTVFDKLRLAKTKFGGSLSHLIQVANKIEGKETVGIFATDGDCYKVMKALLNPAIEFLHGYDNEKALFSCNYDIGLNKYSQISKKEFSEFRVKINRNLADFPYNPHCLTKTRQVVEEKILKSLVKRYPHGKYYDISTPEFNDLKDELFDKELNLISAGSKLPLLT